MRLRQRILVLLGLTAACLIVAMSLLALRLMGSSFASLEHRDASKNVSRAKDAIRQRVADLHDKCFDWAAWDDTYAFMKDRNKAYIESNLKILNLPIDAILYVDPDGRLFYSRAVERTPGVKPPDCAELVKELGFGLPIAQRPGKGKAVAGVVMLRGTPTKVTLWPIIKSSRTGTPRGWIIFAQYLDAGERSLLSKQVHLPLSLIPISGPGHLAKLNGESRAALSSLSKGLEITTRPLSEGSIAGYSLLSDLYGRPIQMIRIEEAREIYGQGRSSTLFLVKELAAIAFVFIVVTLFVLERTVLARLSNLTRQVVEINSLPDSRTRVEPRGRDEIASLGTEINAMLGKLESGARKLRESEEKLRAHNENLELTVFQRTQEIEHQAFHDKLTGLPNRALFMDRLGFALDRAKRSSAGTAALFIDLDNFKLVNDSLGHDMGDLLLVSVATLLGAAVRPGDTVARLGGDEFTILLEDLTSVDEAVAIAQRILAGLRKPIRLGNRETFACASLGIAFTPDSELSKAVLLKNADTAMYRAKASGKSTCVVYDATMNEHAIERLELETDLRNALEREELSVYYQPLIDLQTDRLLGCEALARWLHPVRGFVSPGQFIPIAEDTGLIIPIGYWILEQACHQAKEWLNEGYDPSFTLSVNLSGKQLQREDVVERVCDVLERTGLPPAHLKLEITESVLMDDREDVVRKMTSLKALGIRLALDDFGTGYSSLSTLRAFPIDTLKIDRAFISRLGEEEDALAIVEAILGLARTMKMDVTGEGVETRAQESIIRELGCQTGQGYLYAKPLPGLEFSERFRTSSRAQGDKKRAA